MTSRAAHVISSAMLVNQTQSGRRANIRSRSTKLENCDGMATGKADEGFISGYWSTIADKESKRRYADKLRLVNGSDPYEVPKKDWNDIIDMWPGITYVHACMYLILNPSPYTKEDMLNYKSLDSYRIFQDGWVREVLVKEMNQKKSIVTGKVKTEHSLRASFRYRTDLMKGLINYVLYAFHRLTTLNS